MNLVQSELFEKLNLIVFQFLPEKNEIVFEHCPSLFLPLSEKVSFSISEILRHFSKEEKTKLDNFFEFNTWGEKTFTGTMKENTSDAKNAKACSVKIYQMNKNPDAKLTGVFHNISSLMPANYLLDEVSFIVKGLPEIRKVTHDLNNKFQIITGFGSVIEDEATNPEIKDCIYNVMTALFEAIDLTKKFRSLLPSKKRTEIYSRSTSNETAIKAITEQTVKMSNILVIDDEPMVQRFLCEMIKRLGYTVIGVSNGSSSIEKLKYKTFDLVILDMNLPDIESEKLFLKLKEIQPEIKIILISGDELNDNSKMLLDKGANAFIQKPTSVKKLSEIVKKLLNN